MTDVLRSVGLGGRTGAVRRSDAPWRHVDFLLVSVTSALALLGLLMISSATYRRLQLDGIDPHLYLKKQLLYVAVGAVAMVVVAVIDYRVFCDYAHLLYASAIFLLVAVLFFGSVNKGARSWFELGPLQFQPSEYTKLVLIVALAAYGAAQRMQLDLRRFLTVLAMTALPTLLIYLEPDLGTALVFLVLVLAVLWVAGADPRHIVVLFGTGIVLVLVALELDVLDPYQVRRLTVFVNPSKDTATAAYNLTQSKIAIGSGGWTGRGLFGGTQTTFNFVPEQRTDFIFTAVGEQLGFIGGAAFLALFAIASWRIWRAAASARDAAGTLICVGVLAMLVFQVFQNIGMTMGIMPITGIPLPFVSSGGSSTVISFAAIGLVLNVGMHRFR